MVLLFLTLCLYAVASGFKDGVWWSLTGTHAFHWNEYLIFVEEFATVLLVAFTAVELTFPQIELTVAAFALAFSFCHNKSYYYSRALVAGEE